MIDLHCHILPGVDDGALDIADSVAMALEAQHDGVEIVCATPHIREDHDVRLNELPARVAALQDELDSRHIAVRIARGGELAAPVADRLSAQELREISLDGGGWILLEPAPGPLGDAVGATVELLAGRGARVIVAHPERHAGEGFERRLRALVDRGCLIQWTAEFVARAQPDDPDALVLRLARDGLVHVLASDAHSSHGGRDMRLSPAFARLREVCAPDLFAWIADAPAAIIAGEPLRPPV